MTVTLTKSSLPPDFEERVEAFRKKLLQHRFTEREPAPVEIPLIESCIARVQYPVKHLKPDDFIADYVIIDDTPPPPAPPTLQERKDKLLHNLMMAEQGLVTQLLPAGKTRLYSIKYNDLMAKKSQALLGLAEFNPTSEEKSFIDDYEQIVVRLDKIHRDVAHSLAEIEDLTEDNIDGWRPPNLS